VPKGPIDKLEETKRKLHEKYLQAENGEPSLARESLESRLHL
jgi:hypothetical protein